MCESKEEREEYPPIRLFKFIYYFCLLEKKPSMGKIRACCAKGGCPHLGQRRKKNSRYK